MGLGINSMTISTMPDVPELAATTGTNSIIITDGDWSGDSVRLVPREVFPQTLPNLPEGQYWLTNTMTRGTAYTVPGPATAAPQMSGGSLVKNGADLVIHASTITAGIPAPSLTLDLTRGGQSVLDEIVHGRIEDAEPGTYVAVWTATNGVGSPAEITRTLTIVPANATDTVAPIISEAEYNPDTGAIDFVMTSEGGTLHWAIYWMDFGNPVLNSDGTWTGATIETGSVAVPAGDGSMTISYNTPVGNRLAYGITDAAGNVSNIIYEDVVINDIAAAPAFVGKGTANAWTPPLHRRGPRTIRPGILRLLSWPRGKQSRQPSACRGDQTRSVSGRDHHRTWRPGGLFASRDKRRRGQSCHSRPMELWPSDHDGVSPDAGRHTFCAQPGRPGGRGQYFERFRHNPVDCGRDHRRRAGPTACRGARRLRQCAARPVRTDLPRCQRLSGTSLLRRRSRHGRLAAYRRRCLRGRRP
ncbi:hypothetical protein RAH32_03040 [Paracoccus sp. WLY502]|uniref:hypothetical protein n=1 Tax=Paracoccus yibinensis TaxID=3068891 RepID=UPI00279651AA|nr:hypothetical protein [Paracoccus sp. WLY502]MDQ1899421.1 hypothetical protein [Paracoccus sp. WLY502]